MKSRVRAIGELMTQSTSPRTWSVAGSMLEFRFSANGRWEHLTNGVQDAQGMSLSEVSFPRSALDQVTIDLIPSAHGPFNVLFPWGVDDLGASQTPNFSTATGPSPTPHRYDRH